MSTPINVCVFPTVSKSGGLPVHFHFITFSDISQVTSSFSQLLSNCISLSYPPYPRDVWAVCNPQSSQDNLSMQGYIKLPLSSAQILWVMGPNDTFKVMFRDRFCSHSPTWLDGTLLDKYSFPNLSFLTIHFNYCQLNSRIPPNIVSTCVKHSRSGERTKTKQYDRWIKAGSLRLHSLLLWYNQEYMKPSNYFILNLLFSLHCCCQLRIKHSWSPLTPW